VTQIGFPPATVKQMHDAVLTLKQLLAGEKVFGDKSDLCLSYASRRSTPIYIAASGPRTIELAGEIADGALVNVGCHPAMLKKAREHLAIGAQRGGREADSLDVIWFIPFELRESEHGPTAVARTVATRWLIDPSRSAWLRAAGIEIPALQTTDEFRRFYNSFGHDEDFRRTGSLSSRLISDDLVTRICEVIGIYGLPEVCLAKLKQLAKAGADQVFLSQTKSFGLPMQALKIFEREIFPNLTNEPRSASSA
jgi:5,10-methylenetetrahydromethanopterin reductase